MSGVCCISQRPGRGFVPVAYSSRFPLPCVCAFMPTARKIFRTRATASARAEAVESRVLLPARASRR